MSVSRFPLRRGARLPGSLLILGMALTLLPAHADDPAAGDSAPDPATAAADAPAELNAVTVRAKRLDKARNDLSPITGGSRYTFDQQAIANLVDNAVKFSPPGSTVRLSATVGSAVAIAVADQGPGIPEADRAKATDRFFRGEAARTTPAASCTSAATTRTCSTASTASSCRRASPPSARRWTRASLTA